MAAANAFVSLAAPMQPPLEHVAVMVGPMSQFVTCSIPHAKREHLYDSLTGNLAVCFA